MKDLSQLRVAIDTLDEEVLNLLNQRAKIAVEVGQAKKEEGTVSKAEWYRPEREQAILTSLSQKNEGPLREHHIKNVFKAIMSSCRALQQPLKVAYLGPAGSFSHSALQQHFGLEVEAISEATIPNVFRALEADQVEFAVVPIENSSNGVVTETLDQLVNSPVKLIGEIVLPIRHHVWAHFSHTTIKKIYGHPQALAQCQQYLSEAHPKAEQIAVNSTSKGAKMLEHHKDAAAIASQLAGELYQLKCLKQDVQDLQNNQTRFVVMGKTKIARTGKDKTSMMVMNIPNEPGALFRLVEPFHRFGVNISLPSLRPSKQEAWHYVFYFDVAGHEEDESVHSALEELKKFALVKVLGSYPQGSSIY